MGTALNKDKRQAENGAFVYVQLRRADNFFINESWTLDLRLGKGEEKTTWSLPNVVSTNRTAKREKAKFSVRQWHHSAVRMKSTSESVLPRSWGRTVARVGCKMRQCRSTGAD